MSNRNSSSMSSHHTTTTTTYGTGPMTNNSVDPATPSTLPTVTSREEEKIPLLLDQQQHQNGESSSSKDENEKPPSKSTTSTAHSFSHKLWRWGDLVFRWFTPILERGQAQKKLDPVDMDLVPLPVDCQTDPVTATFDGYWQLELENSKAGSASPSLIRALWRAFGADYVRAGGLKLIHDLCLMVGPQVLHAMMVFLRQADAPAWHGWALTAVVTLSQMTMSLCLRHYFFKCYTTGLRIRTAVALAIYRKALVLSAAERQTRSLGEITNLMSVDAQRLQDLTTYLHSLWSSPLQIGLALFFLWQQLGASSLGGVTIILIMIPVTKYVSQWMGARQKKLMKARDVRTQLNAEVLSAMKVVKFQAWEEPFGQRILALRAEELRQLWEYYVGSSSSRMLWVVTPLLVALATFSAYVWSGHVLDVASALTALALFDILRFPLFMLPQIIQASVEGAVSLNRVRSFLLSKDHHPLGGNGLEDVGIKLRNVSAAYDSNRPKSLKEENKELADKEWELTLLQSQLEEAERKIRQLTNAPNLASAEEQKSSSSLLCLRRIDFGCRRGELVAVVGGVGCGKSSFLSAILGEVRLLTGTAAVRGSLALFSQNPFILNATVRDNIIFGHTGEEVDEALYQRAISCCALQHDLEMLPDGDLTEIGEKGITLSGGQKARVALARAVYHQADITLIDDALSAVDAHVARTLFDEAIVSELMKPTAESGGRSVVLVTNAVQYLSHPRVNKIVVVQEGRVVEQGSYEELSKKDNSVFRRYLTVLDETGVSGSLMEGCAPTSDGPAHAGPPGDADTKNQDGGGGAMLKKAPQKLMSEEGRQTGEVDPTMYLAWSRAAGGLYVPLVILVIFALVEAISILSSWWITYWSAHGTPENQETFLAIYAAIGVFSALAGGARMILIVYFGLTASRKLFSDLLGAVLQAPMSFYDTTPIGRLVNRFSKDMNTVDEQLTTTLRTYLQTLFQVISTAAVISSITPMFTLCLIPMVLFYIKEQRFFTLTYRELKRLDSVNRSPLYALLGETVDGVTVIRAFSAQESLLRRVKVLMDRQQHAYFLTCAAQSWLAVRLELIGTLVVTFACLSALFERAYMGRDAASFAGLAGLSISYALSVTQSLNWSVRMASDLEANMVAVERIEEYAALAPEGDRVTAADGQLPPSWPTSGEIVFQNAKMRYRPELPLVLKGLDIHIPAGCKVGVVGRTGAGKSTLMVALMRLVELTEGSILLDGQDTRQVGLAKLRKNMAVIPQDPVLFSGTLRTNLDPFGEFSEAELYQALQRVGLYKDGLQASSHSLSSTGVGRVESLEDTVAEGGSNFSVGQRQLVVIARALLRKARVVMMDEATAAVDAETDAAIQKVMRQEFAAATCLTVAHRLNTVLDSDLILVMDDGRAAEFDAPAVLLARPGGRFRELVAAATSSSTE